MTGAALDGVPAGPAGVFDAGLLERCISCGFCLPACPTYRLTGDEAASPRGRITLMRALRDGSLPADDPTLREQSSFCLGCRACEPVCPAGVQYGQLLERWRVHQWRGRHRPLLAGALMFAVRRWRLYGLAGALLGAARDRGPAPAAPGASLMLGCVERVLYPRVSGCAARLAPELRVPAGQGCCGALHAHNGELAEGERMARRLGQVLPGTIVTTAGGCAAHLAGVLGSDRVVELSAYLLARQERAAGAVPGSPPAGVATGDGHGDTAASGGQVRAAKPDGHGDGEASGGQVRVAGRLARVTLQDSCHLRNGLGVFEQPRALLRQVAEYVELPGAADCCGSAGSYSVLRPGDSRRVLAPKLDAIEAAGVDFIVAVNPGCLRQLRGGLRRRRSPVRAVHLAELLAMASPPAHPAPDARR